MLGIQGVYPNLGNRIAWEHPLATGLVDGSAMIPGEAPWCNFYGVPATSSATSPVWAPGYRSSNYARQVTAGGSSYDLSPNMAAVVDVHVFTISVWFKWNGSDSGTANISGIWNPNYQVAPLRLGDGDLGNSTPEFKFSSGDRVMGNAVPTNTWQFLQGVSNQSTGINIQIYQDGVQTGIAGTGGTSSGTFSGSYLFVDDTVGRNGGITIGPWFLHNRVLSATECYQLWQESLQGCPNLFRRFTRRVWSFGPIVPIVDQFGFRFRNDDGSETSATWIAAENTNISQPKLVNTRIRIGVDNPSTGAVKLQYRRVGSSDWRDVNLPS